MDRPALMARLDELSGADKVIQEAMRFWTVEMIINRIIDLERGSKT